MATGWARLAVGDERSGGRWVMVTKDATHPLCVHDHFSLGRHPTGHLSKRVTYREGTPERLSWSLDPQVRWTQSLG